MTRCFSLRRLLVHGWPVERPGSVDPRVIRLVVSVALLFSGAVALQLHGSSLALWKTVLNDPSSPSGVLFSTPKMVRSDEWLGWTPAVLSQARHEPAFPVVNESIGAGKTPLLVNLPVRHYSMFFRPQLYGFFLFDLETAYAFYWNVKIWGLFLASFFLLRNLTQQFWLPVFGAGWLLFSAYTQWWFSCPPMLPEMLTGWAVAVLCVIQLFTTGKMLMRVFLTVLLVIAALNFCLCLYPPFQIPLVYLGVALLLGWGWQNHRAALDWRAGMFFVAVAALVIGGVFTAYILECKPTLEIVAATKYPGARRSHGGEFAVWDTFNGVLGFFNAGENQFLAARGNACEASNFYPLWLLVLGTSAAAFWRTRHERRLELMLLGAIGVLTLYTFVPFPEWLCRWTLFNYVPGPRTLLPIGLGGILVTTLLLANPPAFPRAQARLALALAGSAAAALVIFARGSGTEPFLSTTRCLLLLAVNVLFVTLYLFTSQRIFCSTFLLCLVLNNGTINPVATGLGPLLNSDAGTVVRHLQKRDPQAKWMSYTTAAAAQFLKAQGVDVVNGLLYIPDVALCRELDPKGESDSIYNRYAFAIYGLGSGTRAFGFIPPIHYSVDLSPGDPLLVSRQARYAVFPEAVTDAPEYGLQFLARPAGNFWIYRVISPRREKAPPGLAQFQP